MTPLYNIDVFLFEYSVYCVLKCDCVPVYMHVRKHVRGFRLQAIKKLFFYHHIYLHSGFYFYSFNFISCCCCCYCCLKKLKNHCWLLLLLFLCYYYCKQSMRIERFSTKTVENFSSLNDILYQGVGWIKNKFKIMNENYNRVSHYVYFIYLRN